MRNHSNKICLVEAHQDLPRVIMDARSMSVDDPSQGESTRRSQHLNGNSRSVSITDYSINQCTIGLTTCDSWPIRFLSVWCPQSACNPSSVCLTPRDPPPPSIPMRGARATWKARPKPQMRRSTRSHQGSEISRVQMEISRALFIF